ncbi:hypothetical protein GWK47_022587 [Chionoecetes opilio]|uniref:Uncharacterized protein n=1 Tax=Chionoecetes opilio TaxID=41210 RepID=A0A8J5BUR2_CHIOP|nr:hypothetical protein GWK47_022587 [Chionoecetes opilio]
MLHVSSIAATIVRIAASSHHTGQGGSCSLGWIRFFVFDSYVRTENEHWREVCAQTTGRASVSRKTCFAKVKAATSSLHHRSKDGLDGASKRGCPKAMEDRAPPKRGWPPALLGESFAGGHSEPEVAE